ncbi:MAG TPA: hypothetical protein VHM69_05325 [Rubrobacter sp.]|nr:hypothetical protein [Rubrobacter sp.]
MSEERERRGSLLGVVAYVLVPGERRVRAAGHFRKAGFEALRGVGALMRPEGSGESKETTRRERIEIE